MEREEIIARLRAAPGQLRSALTRTGGSAARAPDGEAWSARDVFDHVRATDVFHASQIFLIVAAHNPPIPGADERLFVELAGFAEDDPEGALAAYAARRGELVRLLERLDEAGWQRAGLHPAWGRTTVERYARHIVSHEAEHLTQIERILSTA